MSIQFLKFLKEWNSGKTEYLMKTSGSTGVPKEIHLLKSQMVYSAEQTYKELEFNALTKIYNCIPVDKIGGFMNWVRAVHFKLDIQTVKPSSDPMEHLSLTHNFTFVSLVPYQLYSILKNDISKLKLDRFHSVLIGGAELNSSVFPELMEMNPVFWESYGMTETCSHIGLRQIGESNFRPIGDIQWNKKNDDFEICGSVTGHKSLLLNDILEISENGSFKITGRKDFIINSGGVKLSPESIERKIIEKNPHLLGKIMCTSLRDFELGSKLILLVSSCKVPLDSSALTAVETPKLIFWNINLIKTSNGKLNRVESVKSFSDANLG